VRFVVFEFELGLDNFNLLTSLTIMVESGMNVRPELRTQFVKEMSAEYKRIEYKYQESAGIEKIGVN
jgi:hypothetical protein